MDLNNFKTSHIVYKARNNLLPGNIQRWFSDGLDYYNLRVRLNLRQPTVNSTLKSMCLCLWGEVVEQPNNIKDCKHIAHYKKQLIIIHNRKIGCGVKILIDGNDNSFIILNGTH